MRQPTRRVWRAAAIAAVGAIALAACSSSSTKTTSTTSASGSGGQGVKIGFFGALTGANAALGINEYDGAKLAVDQHNQKGGTQVQLIKYDSQGDPTQAPQLAQKAISDHVVAVVGPAFSGESKTADPIFEQAQIVNITASATATSLATNGWKYWHRAVGNDNSQGPAAANYIAKKLSAKTAAVIDDNSEYGLGIANTVRSTLSSDSVNVAVSDHIDPKAQDYSATVNKVKAANVGAIFYGGYYAEGGRLLKQLRDGGVTAKFVSDDGADDPKLISTAGASEAEGAIVTCPCGDITKNPNATSFVSAYTASAGAAPGTYSAEAFDATNAVLAAIDAGNSTGPTINQYLSTIDYTGLANTIKFDTTNQIVSPTIYVYEVKSGSLVYDGPVNQLIGG
jgi:branched-chain amino acid transport system substrate-binding protein